MPDEQKPQSSGNPVVDYIKACLARFAAAMQIGNFNEAEGIVDDILIRVQDDPNALAFKGVVLASKGRFEEAITYGERALAIGNLPQWHGFVASWYRIENNLPRALEHARLSITPNIKESADARLTLSNILIDLGEDDEATSLVLGVIGACPDAPDPRMHLAQILLRCGIWRPGWRAYEDRNALAMATELAPLPSLKTAKWNGMPLPTGRLVVIGDQGFGDSIQFLRFLPEVARLCHEVYLGVSTELYPLVKRSVKGMARIDNEYSKLLPAPGANAHARLTSLAHYLDITPEKIPTEPYLFADPVKTEAWRARLPSGYPKVGLAWRGRPAHPNDARRSIKLQTLFPLAGVNAKFVSVQQPITDEEIILLERFGEARPLQLSSFDETAAVIANLDLLITVDTSVAHLAGAMGKPVWVMIAKTADWRWMTGTDRTMWYPSMRLFRQLEHGNWTMVVDKIARELRALTESHLEISSWNEKTLVN